MACGATCGCEGCGPIAAKETFARTALRPEGGESTILAAPVDARGAQPAYTLLIPDVHEDPGAPGEVIWASIDGDQVGVYVPGGAFRDAGVGTEGGPRVHEVGRRPAVGKDGLLVRAPVEGVPAAPGRSGVHPPGVRSAASPESHSAEDRKASVVLPPGGLPPREAPELGGGGRGKGGAGPPPPPPSPRKKCPEVECICRAPIREFPGAPSLLAELQAPHAKAKGKAPVPQPGVVVPVDHEILFSADPRFLSDPGQTVPLAHEAQGREFVTGGYVAPATLEQGAAVPRADLLPSFELTAGQVQGEGPLGADNARGIAGSPPGRAGGPQPDPGLGTRQGSTSGKGVGAGTLEVSPPSLAAGGLTSPSATPSETGVKQTPLHPGGEGLRAGAALQQPAGAAASRLHPAGRVESLRTPASAGAVAKLGAGGAGPTGRTAPQGSAASSRSAMAVPQGPLAVDALRAEAVAGFGGPPRDSHSLLAPEASVGAAGLRDAPMPAAGSGGRRTADGPAPTAAGLAPKARIGALEGPPAPERKGPARPGAGPPQPSVPTPGVATGIRRVPAGPGAIGVSSPASRRGLGAASVGSPFRGAGPASDSGYRRSGEGLPSEATSQGPVLGVAPPTPVTSASGRTSAPMGLGHLAVAPPAVIAAGDTGLLAVGREVPPARMPDGTLPSVGDAAAQGRELGPGLAPGQTRGKGGGGPPPEIKAAEAYARALATYENTRLRTAALQGGAAVSAARIEDAGTRVRELNALRSSIAAELAAKASGGGVAGPDVASEVLRLKRDLERIERGLEEAKAHADEVERLTYVLQRADGLAFEYSYQRALGRAEQLSKRQYEKVRAAYEAFEAEIRDAAAPLEPEARAKALNAFAALYEQLGRDLSKAQPAGLVLREARHEARSYAHGITAIERERRQAQRQLEGGERVQRLTALDQSGMSAALYRVDRLQGQIQELAALKGMLAEAKAYLKDEGRTPAEIAAAKDAIAALKGGIGSLDPASRDRARELEDAKQDLARYRQRTDERLPQRQAERAHRDRERARLQGLVDAGGPDAEQAKDALERLEGREEAEEEARLDELAILDDLGDLSAEEKQEKAELAARKKAREERCKPQCRPACTPPAQCWCPLGPPTPYRPPGGVPPKEAGQKGGADRYAQEFKVPEGAGEPSAPTGGDPAGRAAKEPEGAPPGPVFPPRAGARYDPPPVDLPPESELDEVPPPAKVPTFDTPGGDERYVLPAVLPCVPGTPMTWGQVKARVPPRWLFPVEDTGDYVYFKDAGNIFRFTKASSDRFRKAKKSGEPLFLNTLEDDSRDDLEFECVQSRSEADATLLAALRQALIDARNAAVPETVRAALVQWGDDLTKLIESLGEVVWDMIVSEKLKILAKLIAGEEITKDDWDALAFELLSDLALGPAGKALFAGLFEAGSKSLAKIKGGMVDALEKKGTQGAARKVDDALKARHAPPAGAPKSPTDVRPPDSPPLAAQPGPKPPPAAARPREGGAPGDAGPKAPPQHGGEVAPAGKPTRAEGPPEAGGAQPDARPVKEPEGAKPETPPAGKAGDKERREALRKEKTPKIRELRAKLPPGKHTMPDGSVVTIDAHGRTVRIEVDRLDTSNPAKRSKHREASVGHVGGAGFEGGHLYGRQFGGASEIQNLVPMSQAANRRFSAIEGELSAAIARGQEVKGYSVMLDWGDSLDVPRSFKVRAIVRDPVTGREFPIKERIKNLP